MASFATFAGAPFLLPIPELEEFFRLRLPLDGMRMATPERTWPGPYSVGITYPLHWPDRPTLRLNEFFYPTHMSRWSEWNGVVDQAGYELIKSVCWPSDGSGPNPATFTLSQDDLVSGTTNSVSTQMFALPPRPLAKVSPTDPGLYLVTLVDQRWFLQWETAGSGLPTSSWDSLLSYVAGNVGITLTYDATAAAYGLPHPQSALYDPTCNVAMLLDAIASNTGRVIVRNMDGTYKAQNATTAAGLVQTVNLLAGGDLTGTYTSDGVYNFAPNALLPANVAIAFPYVIECDGGFKNPGLTHLPFPQTEGDIYSITVPISTALPGTTYHGFSGRKIFRSTAEAYIPTSTSSVPDNTTALTSLATQIAQDWYLWQLDGIDETIPGIFAWVPEGYHDVTWVWTRERTFTRVSRKPYNFGAEVLCHHFTAPACSSSACDASCLEVVIPKILCNGDGGMDYGTKFISVVNGKLCVSGAPCGGSSSSSSSSSSSTSSSSA